MPDKASTAVPEKWSTRYRGAKAQLHILPPIPLLEEDNYEGVRFQCEEVIELIDELAALTVRAEQAEAKVARLSTPVSNEEWIKANYQQGIATGIPKDQEGKESVMTWRQFTTRKDIDALIASRLATPEPPKEAQ